MTWLFHIKYNEAGKNKIINILLVQKISHAALPGLQIKGNGALMYTVLSVAYQSSGLLIFKLSAVQKLIGNELESSERGVHSGGVFDKRKHKACNTVPRPHHRLFDHSC